MATLSARQRAVLHVLVEQCDWMPPVTVIDVLGGIGAGETPAALMGLRDYGFIEFRLVGGSVTRRQEVRITDAGRAALQPSVEVG